MNDATFNTLIRQLQQTEKDAGSEIKKHWTTVGRKEFVRELAEFFRPTEIVLILRAAQATLWNIDV